MTQISFSHTSLEDSAQAGEFIGRDLRAKLDGETPDVVLVFSSSRHSSRSLLASLRDASGCPSLVGSTCAGEFIAGSLGTGSVSAMAIRAPGMRFSIGLGRDFGKDMTQAVRELVAGLHGIHDYAYPFRTLLVLTDALAGQAEEIMNLLNQETGGVYQVFGGGAGDDAKFERTEVFRGMESHTGAVVALEICSKKPFGIGVSHGWTPASAPLRVTQSSGAQVVSLNAAPAVEVFRQHAARIGQAFDAGNPMPFFLHNILGIETPHGIKLRVPLRVGADGSIHCAAEVPEGATVRIMTSSDESSTEAARKAARTALGSLGEAKPKAAIFFDCVATRLKMGKAFGGELDAMARELGNIPYVGCNTYGQIAKVEGQFNGFHNCTAVVCVIPD
jgi:hypothetical protein